MEPTGRIERPLARYKLAVLPLNYEGMEPREGIEPSLRPYQGRVLPLNYKGLKIYHQRNKRGQVCEEFHPALFVHGKK